MEKKITTKVLTEKIKLLESRVKFLMDCQEKQHSMNCRLTKIAEDTIMLVNTLRIKLEGK